MSSHDIETPLHRPAPGNLKLKALVALVIAIGVVGWGITTRANDRTTLDTEKQAQLIPTVNTIQPAAMSGNQTLTLPGTLQAYYSATVYARVSGYLKSWSVDIGAPVKTGQVLADIETPDLDQQLKQSEAHLDTALADAHLSEITSNRWKRLLATDSVSQQETDQKEGENESRKALVEAARADVERLRVLESFKRITSPFDGVVTARKTDIGALINAGHDAGHELFTVADVHKLRLYVSVPQSYAGQIQKGMKAVLEVPEHPGVSFNATLTDDSRAVSEASGTMLIQLEVDNADNKLLPGEYADVHFELPAAQAQAVQLPANVLSFRKEGLTVATLTADNRVAFHSVKIRRDLGATVEIASGVSATDRVIVNPPDGLENGDKVDVAPAAAAPAPVATVTNAAPAAGAKS